MSMVSLNSFAIAAFMQTIIKFICMYIEHKISSIVLFSSVHPYIFFNQDHTSMTFIGFCATNKGDLIDPVTKEVFHRKILTTKLRNGLEAQKMTFSNDGSSDQ